MERYYIMFLVLVKSILNWLNLQHFYNIMVKYTTIVFGIFIPVSCYFTILKRPTLDDYQKALLENHPSFEPVQSLHVYVYVGQQTDIIISVLEPTKPWRQLHQTMSHG